MSQDRIVNRIFEDLEDALLDDKQPAVWRPENEAAKRMAYTVHNYTVSLSDRRRRTQPGKCLPPPRPHPLRQVPLPPPVRVGATIQEPADSDVRWERRGWW